MDVCTLWICACYESFREQWQLFHLVIFFKNYFNRKISLILKYILHIFAS